MSKPIPVIFMMGPTASGKTELALKIYTKISCEIISVDSVMIYRGMDIGSAKPSKEILNNYPHHLIDIIDPNQAYSAADFRKDAINLIQEIHMRKKIPLLVGGTMLYFSVLQRGLSDMPGADPLVREKITALAEQEGWQTVHAQLAEVDPKAAHRIHPNDPQRIQRALEVFHLTGIPISTWQQQFSEPKIPLRALKIALIPEERKLLHDRIEKRFRQMLEQGLIHEVQKLKQRKDLYAELPSMRSVGYRQVWKHLEGEYDFDTMFERAIIATRQLAKRQMTWLRSEENLTVIPAEQSHEEGHIHDICHKIDTHLG